MMHDYVYLKMLWKFGKIVQLYNYCITSISYITTVTTHYSYWSNELIYIYSIYHHWLFAIIRKLALGFLSFYVRLWLLMAFSEIFFSSVRSVFKHKYRKHFIRKGQQELFQNKASNEFLIISMKFQTKLFTDFFCDHQIVDIKNRSLHLLFRGVNANVAFTSFVKLRFAQTFEQNSRNQRQLCRR